jgi:uncharacterized protein YjbJ (UPF0337 family)
VRVPSSDELAGRWKQQLGAARQTWGRLTDDELLQTHGQMQKLGGLIQERYATTRDEADLQIRKFFSGLGK